MNRQSVDRGVAPTIFAASALALAAGAFAQGQDRMATVPPPFMPDVKAPAVQFPAEPVDPARAVPAQAMADAPPPFVKNAPTEQPIRGLGVTTVHFDEPGDGSLWALGNSYKCQFNAGGFTFIPYLGADAPRSFPISFSLQSIEAGGLLDLQPGVVTRDGNRVTIDHGSVQEVYILNLESVEQQFIFAQSPGKGAATISLNVASDLQSADDGAALRFSNELGSVSYTKAITVDALSATAEAPTALVDGGVQITIPASTLANAAYPLTVDPLISVFEVEPGPSRRRPDVAYDVAADGYLVVWENNFTDTDGDVWAERYDFAGAYVAGSTVSVDFTGDNWRRPRVANSNKVDKYLVVAEVGAAGARDIWGRSRQSTGTTQGLPFQISEAGTSGDIYNADVGGDPYSGVGPANFMVVWERDLSVSDHDIHGRPVDVLTDAPLGSTVLIDNSGASVDNVPSISSSNSEADWFIAWQRIDAGNGNILAARVDFSGIPATPTFSVDSSTSDNRNPSVSSRTNTGRYFVAYEENPSGIADIWGREMNGTSIIASNNLTSLENVNLDAARLNPSVETDGTRFMVASRQQFDGSDWDAYVSNYCTDGGTITIAENHENLEFTFENASDIKIGSGYSSGGGLAGDEAMIVFARLNGALGSISGAREDFKSTCCVSDLNESGATDIDDLLEVVGAWGSCASEAPCLGNVNGDFDVDIDDLLAVIAGWGACL